MTVIKTTRQRKSLREKARDTQAKPERETEPLNPKPPQRERAREREPGWKEKRPRTEYLTSATSAVPGRARTRKHHLLPRIGFEIPSRRRCLGGQSPKATQYTKSRTPTPQSLNPIKAVQQFPLRTFIERTPGSAGNWNCTKGAKHEVNAVTKLNKRVSI